MSSYSNYILVIEDSISVSDQNNLHQLVTSYTFPWSFYFGTILPEDVSYTNNYIIPKGWNPPQFSHLVSIENSPFIDKIEPILNVISTICNTNIQILKLKFNFLSRANKKTFHYPHTDIDDFNSRILTAIYYVNESDGPTFLFKQFAPKKNDKLNLQVKIEPKKGKMVIFDSRRFHASSSPVKHDTRIVLNVVFKIPEN